jgi:glycosyltransferase involved in cell wall biosynthesis
MKYVCRHLPSHFKVTLLAASTQEDDALRKDFTATGARLILLPNVSSMLGLAPEIRKELYRVHYDVILSQGFISAFNVVLANFLRKVPHVLTVHGILEEKYLSGKFGFIKQSTLSWVFSKVHVLYAVSYDILEHIQEQLPALRLGRCHKIVIPNGIESELFISEDSSGFPVRQSLGIGADVFLFGFVGRFMQQKGFNYLIDAIELMESQILMNPQYLVLAVGSGDYVSHYKSVVNERNLEHRFRFIPFMNDISKLYRELNVVVMPSVWEACPLQPMEALCSGTPVIASDCIGLRETVRDTPSLIFPSTKSASLAETMVKIMKEPMKKEFTDFAPNARERFDVRHTTRKLTDLIDRLLTDSDGKA